MRLGVWRLCGCFFFFFTGFTHRTVLGTGGFSLIGSSAESSCGVSDVCFWVWTKEFAIAEMMSIWDGLIGCWSYDHTWFHHMSVFFFCSGRDTDWIELQSSKIPSEESRILHQLVHQFIRGEAPTRSWIFLARELVASPAPSSRHPSLGPHTGGNSR